MGTTVRESVLLIAVFTSRCLASSDMARLVCQFRESALPTEVFPLHAGYRCLSYNDRRVFVGDEIPAAAACSIEGLGLDGIYPCYQRGNGSLAFDPSDEEAYRALAARFKKGSDAARWRRCYEAARRCCARIVTPRGAERDPSRCPALWDGWDCWDSAPEDSYEDSYCKEYIYSADAAPSCHYPSRKRCLARTVANSTRAEWDQTTDYTGCTTKSRLVTKYSFHAAMLGVSIALSLPAVVVFFCYRRLRIPRIALHRNLLIVIVVRSALTILQIVALSFDSLEATDEASVMDQNGAGCRLLSALVQLFSNAVFATMLAEGVFLHRLIAAVFKSQPNMVWLYSLAAAIAVLPMVPWTILRVVKYDYSCWATGAADLDWINNGTRVALLAINFILMLDIIRVLLTKLRGVNSWHSDKIKRTARSTLFLLPLFGVNTLVVADKPSVIPSCDWESVFDMVGHTMEGLQGPCVALLYCYMNKEVRMLLKKTVGDACPRLERLRSRVSTTLARRTFTTNMDHDPGGGGERSRPSAAVDDDVDVEIGEAKRSADAPGDQFVAWNAFRDKDPSPGEPGRGVVAWNIPPCDGEGREMVADDPSSSGAGREHRGDGGSDDPVSGDVPGPRHVDDVDDFYTALVVPAGSGQGLREYREAVRSLSVHDSSC